MITETLMFLMRRSMREASRLKLQFVPEHLYFSRFLGTPLLQLIRYKVDLYHAILIMVLSYVYKYDRVPFFDSLPNASCCSTLIWHK